MLVSPGRAVIRYTIPTPDDSPLRGRDIERWPGDAVLFTANTGGPALTLGSTTLELAVALQARAQGARSAAASAAPPLPTVQVTGSDTAIQ